ncbi:NADP-dependent oxidoreductase domain-containing protein [Dactylonectria macrodidyma]|uniref:NADP-dependent oxidoreductase domain-containing protein n=1 Tax=Dactylonectria macrodidyma TaxID=307937 RepID=A0A9P9JPB9_9HYPO|nr:NADP-dependent oxidoreductase domain-containing protein [Dactylonectria macrodidyma]
MTYNILGKEVGDIGFGLLGLTARAIPDDQAFAAIRAALDAGCNYFNGGEFYGPPDKNSPALLRRYLERHPEDASRIVVNIKGALGRDYQPRGDKQGVRESIDACLQTIGPNATIHQFEAARKDPKADYVEETLATIDEYVRAGKIGGISCSEINANTLREAAAKFAVTAVEVELSLFYNEPMSNGLLEACAELNIPVLAYSPLGRGLLGGKIRSPEDIPKNDMRLMHPRFQGGNLLKNLELVAKVDDVAQRKGCTPSQVAINWLLALSRKSGMPKIIPIPGSTNPDRIRENATIVHLTDEDMSEIEEILASFTTAGTRYPAQAMDLLNL